MQNILFIILGLTFLIAGGNWLLRSAVALSLRLNIPKIVIGMTIVSFATSAPELIVSIKAAVDGFPDLALGNVVGSNIANLGLVLAVILLLGSIDVKKSFYTTDWPIMMLASLLFFGFIFFDGVLVRYEGIIMVVGLFLFLVYLLKYQKTADQAYKTEFEQKFAESLKSPQDVFGARWARFMGWFGIIGERVCRSCEQLRC